MSAPLAERVGRGLRELDWALLGAAGALAVVGVLFIQSARGPESGIAVEAVRQAAYLVLGLGVGLGAGLIDYRRVVAKARWIYLGCVALLVAVLFFGLEAGGARSWLPVPGLGVSVQPSELAKVGVVVLVAALAARREPGRLRFGDAALYGLVLSVPVVLVALQPDDGTALTFLPLLAVTVFVSGLRWRWILAAVLALAVLAPFGWSMLRPHQQARLRVVVDPDFEPQGRGYHAIQSRIAVGSGGLAGQGWGQGPQNRLGFLPERHTDYIFAIVAEESGFLGAIVVLGLYLLVLHRTCDAAVLARDRTGAFLCLGALSILSVHLVINVGMVLGLMPTIGIPLPLLSYGGSSLLATFCLLGLVSSVRARRFER